MVSNLGLVVIFLLLGSAVRVGAQDYVEDYEGEERLLMNVIMAGTTEMRDEDQAEKYTGNHVAWTGLDFMRVTDTRLIFAYHFASADSGALNLKVDMPDITFNFEVNFPALPSFRKVLPRMMEGSLYLGGGAGFSYLPYSIRRKGTTFDAENNPVYIQEQKWYWDHSAWNYHFSAGFVIDRKLGVMGEWYRYLPITGKPQFELDEVRVGLVYDL